MGGGAPTLRVGAEWPFCGHPARRGKSRCPELTKRIAVWRHRGRAADPPSHIRVFRTATAFRRHPGDGAVGILDVAGFTVDAVLRVDDKPRLVALLHPLVDAGRAIARRRPGAHLALGGLR